MNITIEQLNKALLKNYYLKIVPVYDDFDDIEQMILILCHDDGLQIATKRCTSLRTATDKLIDEIEKRLHNLALEKYYYDDLKDICDNCYDIL